MKKIQSVDVKNKNVLIRIDTDLPIKDGKTLSDCRLRASLPTLKYLLENGAKVTIIGHIGRPKGKEVGDLKMRPVEDKLIELLGTHQNWQILENLRFNKGEEGNDPELAKQLAASQDLFVQDAFATCHREHASTSAITKILPSYAGMSIQKEVEKLTPILADIQKPFTVILGGAKISDKLPLLKNLSSRAQNFLIGGAIGSTFLAARRHFLGKSLVEENAFREANIIWQNIMDDPNRNIYLPLDIVFSKYLENPAEVQIIKSKDLLSPNFTDLLAVDIGPETIESYKKVIKNSKTIFWNGGMGVAEVPEFAKGTNEIAKTIFELNIPAVIGGGDTVAAVEALNLEVPDNVFLSTGGGATLEFLSGKELPGLKALE